MRTRWWQSCFILAALVIWLFILSGCASAPPDSAAPRPTHTGDKPFDLSALRLPSPENTNHLAYLGIGADDTFALADTRTRILIIEVFNFYCPHCQAEAPAVNRLYQKIERDEALRGNIKIIGIGIGNTAYEVHAFRERFAVPFPLFADRSRALSMQLDVRRTPTFIAWGYHTGGRLQPLLFAPGPIGDLDVFLNRLIRASDLDLVPSG